MRIRFREMIVTGLGNSGSKSFCAINVENCASVVFAIEQLIKTSSFDPVNAINEDMRPQWKLVFCGHHRTFLKASYVSHLSF